MLLFILLPLISSIFSTTPEAFINSFTDPVVMNSIGLTFASGAIATAVGIFTGVPLAFLLARRKFPLKRIIEAIVNLPLVIPHTAAGIALLLVFGRRGLLGQLFTPIGVSFTDNVAGIVVAMLFVSLPFLVNSSREAFALCDKELELVALSDGASLWQAFIHVTMPQAWRGVLAGTMMMWARGISEFGAVVILAYNPKIVPVLVYERFEAYGLTAAQPISLILILIAFVVFFLLRLVIFPEKE